VVFALVACGMHIANAQFTQIPNNDFENWEQKELFTIITDWFSSTDPEFASLTTTKSLDKVDGNFALKLRTIEIEGKDEDVEPGYAVLADFGSEEPESIPWNQTVDKLHVSAKYSIKEGDAAIVMVALYNESGPICQQIYNITGSSGEEWVNIEIPLEFIDGDVALEAKSIILGLLSSTIEDAYNLFEADFSEVPYRAIAGSFAIFDNVYFTLGSDPTPILVPNNSFEFWEDVTSYEPVSWGSYNYLISEGSVPVTKYDEDGIVAARLEVMNSYWGDKIGHIYLTGDNFVDGVPYTTDAPSAVIVTYKYIPVDGGQAYINIGFKGLLGGNESWQGGGFYNLEAAPDGFIRKGIQLPGFGEGFTPERLYIDISGGENVGSVLYIDKVEFAEFSNVTFRVLDKSNSQPIANAFVRIEGFHHQWMTGHDGRLVLPMDDGVYDFEIAAYGYITYKSSFTLDGEDKTVWAEMDAFVPDPTMPVIVISDADHDKVYFDGNFFQAQVTLPSGIVIPDGSNIQIAPVIYKAEDDYISYNVFKNDFSVSPVYSGQFTVSGTVDMVEVPGVIGMQITHIEMGAGNWQPISVNPFPVIDTYKYNPDISDRGMAFVGIAIPEGDVISIPAFKDVEDLFNNWSGIAFVKEGHGSLYYPYNLNVIDNRGKLSALSGGFDIVAIPHSLTFYVEVNPVTLSFMTDHSVVVTMENIPEGIKLEDIDIVYTSFGQMANEHSGLAYNTDQYALEDGVFSFKVHGFSRYTLKFAGQPTGMDSLNGTKEVSVYPNPVTDNLYISSSKNLSSVTVTTLSGIVVITEAVSGNVPFDLSRLASGTYLLTIEFEDGGKTVKTGVKK
jgi:hypothetical protein